MNRSMIGYILGYILKIEAILLLLPCAVGAIYREREILAYLIIAISRFSVYCSPYISQKAAFSILKRDVLRQP